MTINYNVSGKKRKELAQAIAKWTGCELKYLGAPSFAYQIECFTIDKDGTLSFDSGIGDEVVERLLEHLHNEGFVFEDFFNEPQVENTDENYDDDPELLNIVIQMPRADYDDKSLQNLKDLIDSKADLIKKAFNTERLEVQTVGDKLEFPWFKKTRNPDEIKTYLHFITALCEMAKKLTRINKSEKSVENEKYAFRSFLLRLGFIGAEYKSERKIQLQNLTGSAAFKSGQKNGKEE